MKRIIGGASALIMCAALVAAPAGAAKARQIKLTGVDTGGLGTTKQLGTGLKNPPRCGFAKTITLKQGKKRVGTLTFTKCQSNGGTGWIYTGRAKLEVGRYKGKLPFLRVAYGPFSPNGQGEVSTKSHKYEYFVVDGSLPTKRGHKVTVVLTPPA